MDSISQREQNLKEINVLKLHEMAKDFREHNFADAVCTPS